MTVPFNFATQSGNIPLSELDANFANVSAHATTATYVTANNQPNITNVGALNSLSVYGNVNTGNVFTNGIVRANLLIGVNYTGTNLSITGNIRAGNIVTEGVWQSAIVSATGNVIGANLVTAGYVTAVGNIIGSNVQTPNLAVNRIYSDDSTYVTVEDGLEIHGELLSESLEVTGDSIMNNLTVTGNFIGTDIQVNSIVNGSSNVDITNLNGNVTIGVDGVNNVMVVTSTGANIAGNLDVTGNITANIVHTPTVIVNDIKSEDSTVVAIQDGLEVHGDILVNGNISGYNLVINSITSDDSTSVTIEDRLSVHGDADILGDVSATGNIITGANLIVSSINSTTVNATGNIVGGNLAAVNLVINNILSDDSTIVVVEDGLEVHGDGIIDGNLSVTGDITAVNVMGDNVETVNLVVGNISSDGSTALTVLNDLSVHSDVDVIGDISATSNIVGETLVGNTVVVNFVKSDTSSYVLVEDGLSVHGGVDILGDITATGNVTGENIITNTAGAVITAPTALANLTAIAGARAFINNANLVASGNFGVQVGSGGANVVPVWSDGTNWYIG